MFRAKEFFKSKLLHAFLQYSSIFFVSEKDIASMTRKISFGRSKKLNDYGISFKKKWNKETQEIWYCMQPKTYKIVKISIWKKHLLISKQKEHEHLTCCHLRSFPFCEINLSNPMSNYGNFDVTNEVTHSCIWADWFHNYNLYTTCSYNSEGRLFLFSDKNLSQTTKNVFAEN